MKLELVMPLLPVLFAGVIFQFMPLLTRPGIFFGATVDPDFPHSENGRRLLRSYRLQAALWTLVACGLAVVLIPLCLICSALLPMLVLLLGFGLSYRAKFRQIHQHYGVRRPEVREAELTTQNEQVSGISWWVFLPFVAIAAIAFYLNAHWDQLPSQFPVHWGADGQPNGWATRSLSGVYGPLLAALGIDVLCLVLACALPRLSRNTAMRHVSITILLLVMYPVTFAFSMVALLPLVTFPLWLIPVVTLTFVAAILIWSIRKTLSPMERDVVREPQSDSYWKAGMFYYNPSDPAVFVSKRVGIGYTMNFANKVAWFVLAGILLIALLPALLLKAK